MNQEEHEIQCALVEAARNLPYCEWLYAVPNGGKRNIRVAVKLKREGVRRGIPDLFLPVPSRGFHGLYIEVKTPHRPGKRGGYLSPNQKEFKKYALQNGYQHKVVRSVQVGIDVILEYLGRGNAK